MVQPVPPPGQKYVQQQARNEVQRNKQTVKSDNSGLSGGTSFALADASAGAARMLSDPKAKFANALQYAKGGRDRTKASYDRLKKMYDFLKNYKTDDPKLKSLIEKAKTQMKALLDARRDVYKTGKELIKNIEDQVKKGNLDPEEAATLLNRTGAMLHGSANEDEKVDAEMMPTMNLLGYNDGSQGGSAAGGETSVTSVDSFEIGEDVPEDDGSGAGSEDGAQDL